MSFRTLPIVALSITVAMAACQGQPPAQPKDPYQKVVSAPEIAGLDTPPVVFPQYPSISPDTSSIVFSYAGDLWSVARKGGVAERLTAHPADEERSAFSPDGAWLAFESERDGPRNIYIMPLARAADGRGPLVGGAVRRVTISDRAQTLSGFSADGRHIYFTSSHEPALFRGGRMYRASVDAPEGGGARMERLTDAFGSSPRPGPQNSILFHRGRYDGSRPRYTGASTSDLYRLDEDGVFTQLTTDAHQDAEAFALPDGSIIFISARDGQNNLWRLPPGVTDKGGVPQLTSFSTGDHATIAHGVRDLSVAPGGAVSVFCVWDTIYTLDMREPGARPVSVPIAAGGDFALLDFERTNIGRQVSEAALSPDGKTLAAVARGEILIRSTDKDRPTRRLFGNRPSGMCRARDLAWSPDGRTLYFTCDDTGINGVYAATVALAREDLGLPEQPERIPESTPQPAEPTPEPGAPGTDPAQPQPPQPEPPEPAPATPSPVQPTPTDPPSPDAAAKQPGSDTDQVPAERPASKEDAPKPDHGKRWAESLTYAIEPVAVGEEEQSNPLPSPDGKHLLYTRGLGDLILRNLGDGSEHTLIESWNEPSAHWTADSRHIIYQIQDYYFNADIWLMDALGDGDAAKPINLTRHPDYDHSPRLSADGKVLYFLSDRDAAANGQDEIFAVNLDRKLDGLRPYELADHFKEAADKAKKRKPLAPAGKPAAAKPDEANAGEDKPDEGKKDDSKPGAKIDPEPSPDNPLKFDAEDAYLRIRKVVPTTGDVGNLATTPGGERIIYSGSIDGSPALYSVDHAGRERKTIASGSVSGVAVNLAGDRVLYLTGSFTSREPALGRPTGGESERFPFDAPVTIDIAAQQRQKFTEAARIMGARFYHPTLKGLDWPAITARYMDLAVRTRTDTEFNRLFNLLLGELDGSHMGMGGGRDTAGSGQSVGHLGIDVKPVPGGYEVTRVVPGSPADATSTRLHTGEIILAINGRPVAAAPEELPGADLTSLMAGTAGQETLLEVRRAGAGSTRYALITPVSSGTDGDLRYQDGVLRRAAEVERLSGGKLGYLHIRGMNMASVRDFERDLFAAADGKLGLIIDVRDNGGGSTTDILLASLTAPRHAYTAARGVDLAAVPKDAYPRDRRLIYAWNRPINVLINYNSYSNAEIFAHAIKTIGRGTIIGTPTFGAVISTGSTRLLDGTTMRMPFRGWYLPDGTDMEHNGCQPDLLVEQTPEDEAAGRDRQLEAAVKELLPRAKPL